MGQPQRAELSDGSPLVLTWDDRLPKWADPKERHVQLTITPLVVEVAATVDEPAHEEVQYRCVVESMRERRKGEALFDFTLRALPGQTAEFLNGRVDVDGNDLLTLQVIIRPE